MDSDSSDLHLQLEEVIAVYLCACEEGKSPNREALLQQHPELADELRDFFRHRDRMEALIDPLRSAASRVLNIRCPHCRCSVELSNEAQLCKISCPSCGSKFSLAEPNSSAPHGLERIGQFTLVEQVGLGQFGAVWKARDQALERTVAIKIPRRQHMDTAEVELFLRDARVAAQLKHPHIVSVHEVGTHQGTIYIVSDLIQGTTLDEWTKSHLVSFRRTAELCETIARALHYAHDQGVVHRDLKPGNVMMDLAGEPHIVDFGLAKRDVGELTITLEGQILGTPAYMSPEQARGEGHTAGPGADIYSLGVVLYELLTQELPFRGNRRMLLKHILHDRPQSPRSFDGKIPRDLETICLKCLEKEPSMRYATAHDLADDLRRFLDGKPVVARPVPAAVHAIRWCRRNSVIASLLTAVMLLLLLVAAVSSIGYFRTQEALRESETRAGTIELNLYRSQMIRAGQAALTAEGLSEINRLVGHWYPNQNGTDRRGWEWNYLKSLLHQDLATLRGHASGISDLQWSNDGAFLASSSANGVVKIWNGAGVVIHSLSDHRGPVTSIAWNSNATRLATSSSDGSVKLWDVVSGKLLHSLASEESISQIAWHSKNKAHLLAVSHSDFENRTSVVTWDTETGVELDRIDFAFSAPIDIQLDPSGSKLAVSEIERLIIIDLNTSDKKVIEAELLRPSHLAWTHAGDQLAFVDAGSLSIRFVNKSLNLTSTVVRVKATGRLAWHPNESLLAYSEGNKDVHIAAIRANEDEAPVVQTLRGHLKRVTPICFHPQKQLVASGSIDGDIKIWRVETDSRQLRGSAALAWSPDGSKYASRLDDAVVVGKSWDTSPTRPRRFNGHEYHVFDVCWSPNSKKLASYSYAHNIRIWDVDTGKVIHNINTHLPDDGGRWPALMSWHPDGHLLAFADDDQTIRILSIDDGAVHGEMKSACERLNAVSWNPDGTLLAAGSNDGVVRFWDTVDERIVRQFGSRAENDEIVDISWHPDGQQVVCAAAGTGVLVRDLRQSNQWRQLQGHATYVHAVAWSPDGKRIASADDLGSVRIWDASDKSLVIVLKYSAGGGVPDLEWHPSSSTLGAIAYGGFETIQLWNATEPGLQERYW